MTTTQIANTKPTDKELTDALHALYLEAAHFRNTGKGVQFLNAKLEEARKVVERTTGS